jgi:predicted RNase H-like nuclease
MFTSLASSSAMRASRYRGGRPLDASKKTWAGLHKRLQLLDAEGIALGADLGTAGTMAVIDDVLDAAAAAWTARRIAEDVAVSLPSTPEGDTSGRQVAIRA